METEPDLNTLGSNLDRQLYWIKSAEDRLRFFLPVALAMLAALAITSPEIDRTTTILIFATIPATVFLVLYLIISFLVLSPDLSGGNKSLLYFGDISSTDIDDYTNQILARTYREHMLDIATQIHINAKIAKKKYERTRTAMFMLACGSVFWAFSLFNSTQQVVVS